MKAEDVIKIAKETPWQIQEFSAYPFYLCAAANPSAWEVNRQFGRGYRHFLFLFERGTTRMFYDEQDWNTIFSMYQNEIKTTAKLRVCRREAVQRYARAKRETRYAPSALKTYPLEKLIQLALLFAWRIGFSRTRASY